MFKVGLLAPKKICFICINKNTFKIMKNTFVKKALFVLKNVTFWSYRGFILKFQFKIYLTQNLRYWAICVLELFVLQVETS